MGEVCHRVSDESTAVRIAGPPQNGNGILFGLDDCRVTRGDWKTTLPVHINTPRVKRQARCCPTLMLLELENVRAACGGDDGDGALVDGSDARFVELAADVDGAAIDEGGGLPGIEEDALKFQRKRR